MNSPTSFSEASEKYDSLCFYFMICLLWSMFFMHIYFFDAVRREMKLKTEIICYSSSEEDLKLIKRICHVKTL